MEETNVKFNKCFQNEVTSDMLMRAKEELGETPETRKICLNQLKEFIRKEPEFLPCMEDGFLLGFLRAKKFNVVKAFKNLKNYYTYKAQYSGTVTDFKPSDIRTILEQNAGIVLDYRDHEDTLVAIVKVGKLNYGEIQLEMLIAVYLICSEVCLESPLTQVAGHRIIFDFTDFTLQKVLHVASPSFFYKLVLAFQDVLPFRLKGLHFINEPPSIGLITRLLRLFMSDKLYKRVYLHGKDLESLHAVVSPDILPKEYGGLQASFEETARAYNEIILSAEELLAKRNEYGFTGKVLHKLSKKH